MPTPNVPVYLGIDYGEKRIGLAHGDELGFAFPLPAAVEPELESRLLHITEELKRRRVTDLVVGYPLRLDGSRSPTTDRVDEFIEVLTQRFGLPIHRWDEALTSSAAAESLGHRKPRSRDERRAQVRTGEIDSKAAQILLQGFLDRHHGAGLPPPPDAHG